MSVENSIGLYYLQQLSVFLGCPILISGLIGNILCVIVFLSLRTFQNNACSFYLTCGCFVSIFKLIGGLFPRLIVIGFNPDFATSNVYCKFLGWLCQFCSGILLTCICLATLNHYLATSIRPAWQRYSQLKVGYYLLGIISLIWFLHIIPYMLAWNVDKTTCTLNQSIAAEYFKKVYFSMFHLILPVLIMNVFVLLSVHNIRRVDNISKNFVGQQDFNRQLTKMLLTQVIFVTTMTIMFMGHYIYFLNTNLNDPFIAIQQQTINSFLYTIWYLCYSAPLYIYLFCSGRFRKQCYYVLFKRAPLRCPRRVWNNRNQIEPSITSSQC